MLNLVQSEDYVNSILSSLFYWLTVWFNVYSCNKCQIFSDVKVQYFSLNTVELKCSAWQQKYAMHKYLKSVQ